LSDLRAVALDREVSQYFIIFLGISLSIAFLAFAGGAIVIGGCGGFGFRMGVRETILISSFVFAALWACSTILAIVFYGWKGLWFLLGAPLASFWLIVALAMVRTAAKTGRYL
jgi:hypothetical protein